MDRVSNLSFKERFKNYKHDNQALRANMQANEISEMITKNHKRDQYDAYITGHKSAPVKDRQLSEQEMEIKRLKDELAKTKSALNTVKATSKYNSLPKVNLNLRIYEFLVESLKAEKEKRGVRSVNSLIVDILTDAMKKAGH